MTSAEERFTALFDRTRMPLLAYAVRRVTDPADAADIVAETFLVAWRRLDEIPDGEQARLWLYGVARNVVLNHHRGERRRHALADRLRSTLQADLAEPVVPARTAVVAEAMARLGEEDRELLRLLAWEQLARDEIATAMGLSRGAVRVRLHRARRRLERAMAEAGAYSDRPPDTASRAVPRTTPLSPASFTTLDPAKECR